MLLLEQVTTALVVLRLDIVEDVDRRLDVVVEEQLIALAPDQLNQCLGHLETAELSQLYLLIRALKYAIEQQVGYLEDLVRFEAVCRSELCRKITGDQLDEGLVVRTLQ